MFEDQKVELLAAGTTMWTRGQLNQDGNTAVAAAADVVKVPVDGNHWNSASAAAAAGSNIRM